MTTTQMVRMICCNASLTHARFSAQAKSSVKEVLKVTIEQRLKGWDEQQIYLLFMDAVRDRFEEQGIDPESLRYETYVAQAQRVMLCCLAATEGLGE